MPTRIVIYGPECTGKTTLARLLAETFSAELSGEFVRQWVADHARSPTLADLPTIATGQLEIESAAAHRAGPHGIVLHDTDLHTHCIYARHYLGAAYPPAEQAARSSPYTHHLLCEPDLPWQPDPLQRDSPETRATLFPKFLEELHQHHRPYTRISGTGDPRTARAIEAVRRIIASR